MVLAQPGDSKSALPTPSGKTSSKDRERSRDKQSRIDDDQRKGRLSRIMLETDDDDKVAKTKAHLRKLINDLEMKLENFDDEVAKAAERAKERGAGGVLKKDGSGSPTSGDDAIKKSINFDDQQIEDESALGSPTQELSRTDSEYGLATANKRKSSKERSSDKAGEFIDEVTARLDADLSAVALIDMAKKIDEVDLAGMTLQQ